MIVLTKSQLLYHKSMLIPNNALKKNVQANGPTAKKTPNVSQPFKIARKNVEPKPHAGLYAFLEKEVKLQLMLLSALNQMDVLALFHKLFH